MLVGGAGIVVERPLQIFLLTLALMLIKGMVLYGLGRAFAIKGRDRWLFTLGLAQAGEFGFVLTSFAVAQPLEPALRTR